VIWLIASVPFWTFGSVIFLSGIINAVDGIRGNDPLQQSVNRFCACMLVGGAMLYCAAKIAS